MEHPAKCKAITQILLYFAIILRGICLVTIINEPLNENGEILQHKCLLSVGSVLIHLQLCHTKLSKYNSTCVTTVLIMLMILKTYVILYHTKVRSNFNDHSLYSMNRETSDFKLVWKSVNGLI